MRADKIRLTHYAIPVFRVDFMKRADPNFLALFAFFKDQNEAFRKDVFIVIKEGEIAPPIQTSPSPVNCRLDLVEMFRQQLMPSPKFLCTRESDMNFFDNASDVIPDVERKLRDHSGKAETSIDKRDQLAM